jgi:uncharacterized protein
MKVLKLLCALLFCALLAACPKSGNTVNLRGKEFTVEIANNDALRTRGLMFRESMDADKGMLFIFDDLAQRNFWMHNCKISLDILYFDADLKLVSSALSVPPCSLSPEQCPNYPSSGPAKYVLELNAGVATQIGVQAGDVLTVNYQ